MKQNLASAKLKFSTNSLAKWHLLRIGIEKTPVILIDNFLADIQTVRQLALNADFQQQQSSYFPGIKAELANTYIDFVLGQVTPAIAHTYRLNAIKGVTASGYLQLINQAEKNLNKPQCIPHFDSLNKKQFAIMHYINSGDFGGTGFYRHIPTQFENIEENKLSAYQAARYAFEQRHGQPKQAYINQSTAEFKLLGKIAYKANRLLIYPGTLLHSGLIQTQTDLSEDPKNGRLTVNIFAEFNS